jgi:hypothetical protein
MLLLTRNQESFVRLKNAEIDPYVQEMPYPVEANEQYHDDPVHHIVVP